MENVPESQTHKGRRTCVRSKRRMERPVSKGTFCLCIVVITLSYPLLVQAFLATPLALQILPTSAKLRQIDHKISMKIQGAYLNLKRSGE